jgi:hypothetical protein
MKKYNKKLSDDDQTNTEQKRDENPRIYSVPSDTPKITIDEWRAIVSQNFPGLEFGAELCLSVFIQLLLLDIKTPFGLVLMDAPSSGKTQILNFFCDINGISYPTDKFTPAAFVSNAANVKRDALEDIDMLPRIKNKVLIVRDMATLFSKREEDLVELLGTLTRVFDGEGLRTDSGIHGKRHLEGEYLFMFLAATTPVQNRVWRIMSTLGSRLFFVNLNLPDPTTEELIDQLGSHTTKIKQDACKAATNNLIYYMWSKYPDGVTWDRDGDDRAVKGKIVLCAELIACIRAKVHITDESDGEPTVVKEKPHRLAEYLYGFSAAHALVSDRKSVNTDDLSLVLKLALENGPTTKRTLLHGMLDHEGVLTTDQIEALLEITTPAALDHMRAIAATGLCSFQETRNGTIGGQQKSIILKPKFKWLLTDECRVLRGLEPLDKSNTSMFNN